MTRWIKNRLTNIFRHTARPAAPSNRFRPSMISLEDRTVPSGSDVFATATVLSGNFVTETGSNVGATGEVGEPEHAQSGGVEENQNSVWWQWSPTSAAEVEINTFGSDYDTVLAVYTGPDVANLTEVASNDDAMGMTSQVFFTAAVGVTYYIAVDGYDTGLFSNVGNIRLHIGTQLPNDDFANAAVVAGGTVTGSNVSATDEAGELDLNTAAPTVFISNFSPNNSAWWSWTSATTGTVQISTEGSDFDTGLVVYTGDSLNTLSVIAANDDGPGIGLASLVTFNAVEGETYFIQVDGFQNTTGDIVLSLPEAGENHAPVVDDQSFSLNENSPTDTLVGTVIATDEDAGDALTYSITGGSGAGVFAINSSTGAITVVNSGALNYESTTSFTLNVMVQDDSSELASDNAIITINLNDVNEAPVITAADSFSVPENSANGAAVGSVSATDVDAGQTLTYAITGGNTDGAFAIDSLTGAITVANMAALNYEAPINSFTLTVEVSDNGSPQLSDTEVVTVNLTNVNEAPTAGSAGPFSLAENSANGTSVGSVPSTDPDAGDAGIYSFLSGNTNGAFAINPTTGQITVANAAALDFETTAVFNVTVRVTDGGGLTADTVVTINLSDVFEGAAQEYQNLRNMVDALKASGSLSNAQAQKLKKDLDASERQYNKGNVTGAKAELQMFIDQVNVYVLNGTLTPTQGDTLKQKAQFIIDNI